MKRRKKIFGTTESRMYGLLAISGYGVAVLELYGLLFFPYVLNDIFLSGLTIILGVVMGFFGIIMLYDEQEDKNKYE